MIVLRYDAELRCDTPECQGILLMSPPISFPLEAARGVIQDYGCALGWTLRLPPRARRKKGAYVPREWEAPARSAFAGD